MADARKARRFILSQGISVENQINSIVGGFQYYLMDASPAEFETRLAKIMELHPDKDVILELFASKNDAQKDIILPKPVTAPSPLTLGEGPAARFLDFDHLTGKINLFTIALGLLILFLLVKLFKNE